MYFTDWGAGEQTLGWRCSWCIWRINRFVGCTGRCCRYFELVTRSGWWCFALSGLIQVAFMMRCTCIFVRIQTPEILMAAELHHIIRRNFSETIPIEVFLTVSLVTFQSHSFRLHSESFQYNSCQVKHSCTLLYHLLFVRAAHNNCFFLLGKDLSGQGKPVECQHIECWTMVDETKSAPWAVAGRHGFLCLHKETGHINNGGPFQVCLQYFTLPSWNYVSFPNIYILQSFFLVFSELQNARSDLSVIKTKDSL